MKRLICLAGVLLAAFLALPAPTPAMPTSCTTRECIAQCSDCPFGHTSYCISTATCECGCR